MKNNLINKTFVWMWLGLLVTFLTAFVVSINENMLLNIFSGIGYIICIVVEIALVIFLSARIMKMEPTTAKVVFLLYSFVSGLTFSSIFIVYEVTSIMYIFLLTALVFGVMAFIGYTTKIDLTKIGTYFIFGLLGALLVTIINSLFIHSSGLELTISIIILILFLAVTAHDVQKIKALEGSGLPEDNLAIYGALDLYLDFINIFLDLLRLFGNAKD